MPWGPCNKAVTVMRDSGVLRPQQATHGQQTARVLGHTKPSVKTRRGLAARRTLGGALLSLSLLGAPARVGAQDDAATAMARERFREGVQFFDQKQFDKARAAFLQAYALKRHPAVLLNLAQSELRSEHEADAAKHFSQYLREHKEASEAERQAAESGLTIARAKVAEVVVSVDEEGAAVAIDGNPEGTSPLPGAIFLKPGTHTITAEKDGRTASTQLTVSAAQAASANLRMRAASAPAATPAPPATGNATPAPAQVDSAGRPPEPAAVEASVSSGDRQPFLEWARRSPVAWVGGGLGVLGLGGGVGFWIVSRQNYADADSIAQAIRAKAVENGHQPQGICRTPPTDAMGNRIRTYDRACSLYVENSDDGDSYQTLAFVSAGVGVAALAGTVVYYFVAAPRAQTATTTPAAPRVALAPWLGPAAQGLSVVGEF